MRLYVTPEGRWAGTQAEAKALAKTDASYEQVEVPDSKPALLAWLNERRVGAVVARDAIVAHERAPRPAPAPVVSYAATSIAIDEAWDALPLSHKLHLAALALEEARGSLRAKQA